MHSLGVPIGFREFKSGVETQRHYRCGGLGSSDSSDHAEHSVLVKAHVVIAGRKRKNLVEVLTFHPKLKFARRVIGIFSALNHRDYDDFDTDRTNRRSALGGEIGSTEPGYSERQDQLPGKTAHEITNVPTFRPTSFVPIDSQSWRSLA